MSDWPRQMLLSRKWPKKDMSGEGQLWKGHDTSATFTQSHEASWRTDSPQPAVQPATEHIGSFC